MDAGDNNWNNMMLPSLAGNKKVKCTKENICIRNWGTDI
jgi:hypothetical protein